MDENEKPHSIPATDPAKDLSDNIPKHPATGEDEEDEYEPIPEDPEAAIAIEAHRERMNEATRRDYIRTKNPLHVWKMILDCQRQASNDFDDAHRDVSTEEYMEIVRAKTIAGQWPPTPATLPDWCMRYLLHCAWKVKYLADGLDEKIYPGDGDSDADLAAGRHWRTNPTLDAKDSIARLAGAFGFTRRGWNAFDEHSRRIFKENVFDAYLEIQFAHGLSTSQARDAMLNKLGWEDERYLRRIISDEEKEFRDLYRDHDHSDEQGGGET
jgi:hypothetical protein